MKNYLFLFTTLIFLLQCTSAEESADLVLIGGRVWTGNPTQSAATAIAISADTIQAVGNQATIKKYIGDSTRLIQLDGKFVTPGFIDSHVHFVSGGFRLSSVQLRDASTPEEFIRRIAEFALTQEEGSWITGGDWDHENWGGTLPEKDWIDSVTQNHPLWINRLDGHMALANSAALRAAGISDEIEDIEGGKIIRNEAGELTGIFKDNAMNLIDRAVSEPSNAQKEQAVIAAMDYVSAHGVSSVHHMSGDGNMEVFKRLKDAGKLKTRIYAAVPISQLDQLASTIAQEGKGDKWLKYGGLKGFMDGSLGSHTAAFFEPFSDSPADSGFLVTDIAQMYQWVSRADSLGLQPMIHAIGDRAISDILDIYDQVIIENGNRDRRFRIEHAQHISPKDFQRFVRLNIIASMQPYHAIDDGRWAEKVIGPERIKTTYAFRTLLDTGAKLAFGSDWFVAPPNPLEGIYAAVSRRTLDGQNPTGWVPEQKISVEEALKAYTIHAAFASFEENIKGTIEVGKLADLTVIDQNLLEIRPEEIKNAQVLMTIVGGQIVYQKD